MDILLVGNMMLPLTCYADWPRSEFKSGPGLVLIRPVEVFLQRDVVEARVQAVKFVVVAPCRNQMAGMAPPGEEV